MTRLCRWFLLVGLLGNAPWIKAADAVGATNSPPQFQELYDLVKVYLSASSPETVNEAAVRGLLAELKDRVQWVVETNQATATKPLSRTATYDQTIAYFRVAGVDSNLPAQLSAARDALPPSNSLTGIVLDLRYAQGADYPAAARAADPFTLPEEALLQLDGATLKSGAGRKPFRVPVAVLVNSGTVGAAEALASVLQQSGAGLVIGAPTAGQAFLFKDFQLSNGQRVRVATEPVKTGSGSAINQVQPDLAVAVSAEAEKLFYEEPFSAIDEFTRQPLALGPVQTRPAEVASGASLSPVRRRLTEADLVRQRQEELGAGSPGSPARIAEPGQVIHDPALARALDFLKGIARLQSSR